ncbi:MAG: SDR family NAD(P)-dependent oxidoreductase [Acidobacteriota bacterium]
MSELTDRLRRLTAEQRARLQSKVESRLDRDAIAVVSVACRFPGGASDPEAYWRLLVDEVDAIGEVPAERWDTAALFDPTPGTPGKTSTRWGGFLPGIDGFDAGFFGISPREAVSLDPQQRLFLEVAWEALENAGYDAARLAGSETGVFAGVASQDYAQRLDVGRDLSRIDPYFGTGTAASFVAGRLSHFLGLEGPSLVVDTACSSSLVAVHLACQSLRTGESDIALTGGVNVLLDAAGSVYVSQVRAVAADGRCKAFDASADGYVRAEGCGVVVLKRLADARRDDDPVLAVIRASGVNQDGHSNGLTAPSGRAQEALLRKVVARAGLTPGKIDYVEAHGTGTALGDPIEVEALGRVLGAGRPADRPLKIGSVKSNLGHLEAAAGIAGLIKVVLALRRRRLPRSLHFENPNPHIRWRDLAVEVVAEGGLWESPDGRPRRAGVSSFGFSGTNAHVVLEEAVPQIRVTPDDGVAEGAAMVAAEGPHLLTLSGRSAAAREAQVEQVGRWLREGEADWQDVAYSTALRRSHHDHRLALVAADGAEAVRLLATGDDRWVHRGRMPRDGARRLVFVYSGQGAQWWAMGRELFESSPVFRQELEEVDAEVRQLRGWSPLEELTASQGDSRLDGDSIELTQVCLFALQLALTALWRAWGVEPAAVLGHSMGEVAAAWACGALDRRQAVRLIVTRSELLEAATGRGAMAAVDLDLEVAEAVVAGDPRLAVAAANGPSMTVLSGAREALEPVLAELGSQDVFVRPLRTTGVAGHSPQVDSARQRLEAGLADLHPAAGHLAMISTVTGERVAGEHLDARYWGRNLRQTVRFADAVEASRGDVFVEIGPHPVLAGAVATIIAAAGGEATVLPSLRREEPERREMLATLAGLYAHGVEVDLSALHPAGGELVSLPNYPWQRRRFWVEEPRQARPEPTLIAETELERRPDLRRVVDGLLDHWAVEGARAINRRQLAPSLFLASDQRSLFYVSEAAASSADGPRALTALLFVGPDECFDGLARELLAYAKEAQREAFFFATEEHAFRLRRLGFTTTPCGALQTLADLRSFTLTGNRMRRLRYLVQKFERGGDCRCREHQPGSDPAIDREVVALIDSWLELKGIRASFVHQLKGQILAGAVDPRSRLFLTRRDGFLEGAVLLSPAEVNAGYLMDLEFYGAESPLGCLEFTVVQIIARLLDDGYSYLSLGGTYGTMLDPHPNADPEVEELFATLHDEGILNGDSNFQFKNKFRPLVSSLFLCRLPGGDAGNLSAVLAMLADRPAFEGAVEVVRPDGSLDFSLERWPWLKDHTVAGRVLAPGAALLEVLTRAGRDDGRAPQALAAFAVERPLALPMPDLTVARESDGDWTVRAGDEVIARGQPVEPRPLPAERRDLAALTASAAERLEGAAIYRHLAARGLRFGPAFQSLRELWLSPRRAVARVALEASADGEWSLHPVLLDGALQSLAALLPADDGLYLMAAIDRWTVTPGRLRRELVAEGTLRPGAGEAGVWVGDVILRDDQGQPRGRLEGVVARRLEAEVLDSLPRPDWSSAFLTQTWVERALEAPRHDQPPPRYLVLGEANGAAGAAAAELRRRGAACLEVADLAPDELTGVLDAWRREEPAIPARLVDLRCLDVDTGDDLAATLQAVTDRYLAVLRWLVAAEVEDLRLWWITGRAWRGEPAAASLWGLGRVCANEHPELWGGLVDLEPEALDGSRDGISRLVDELLAESGEEVRLGATGRRVCRLRRGAGTSRGKGPELRSAATYLITGGLGGMGLTVARWMIDGGARRLVLVGRRDAAAAGAEEEVQALRAAGAEVSVRTLDVADGDAVGELVAELAAGEAPLRGVIHAAGVVDDRILARQDWHHLARVFRPKVLGAWNLHRASAELELDFFVLFSSAAAVLGPPGQGSHAAANAALDALARLRRQAGLPALTLGWGAWSEVGGAAGGDLETRLAARGMATLSPRQGLEVLAQSLTLDAAELVILPVLWRRWRETSSPPLPPRFDALGQTPRVPSTGREGPAAVAAVGSGADESALSQRQRLLALPAAQRRQRLITYLRGQAAGLLGLDEDELAADDPLPRLGFDSLMSMELRKRLEGDFEIKLPIVHFFREPTAAGLAESALERLPEVPEGADAAALLERLDELSDDEVDGLLGNFSPEASSH